VTETWLGEKDYCSIGENCPTGYSFYHIPRTISRDGGIGLLMKKRIQVKKQSQSKFKSFEYIDIIAKCFGGCTRIVTMYRPPPSKANRLSSALFFKEFSILAEQLAVASGNLLIVGDFNFHVDNLGNSEAIKFTSILESFNLKQRYEAQLTRRSIPLT